MSSNNTVDPKVDAAESSKFLSWLGNQMGVIYTIDPHDKTSEERPAPIPHSINKTNLEQVLQDNVSQNVYYAINLVAQTTKKTKKEDIKQAWFLHCDVDPQPGQHPNDILDMFDELRPKGVPEPSALVYSGRGYQVLYRLESPLGPEHFDAVESANRWLAEKFGGDHCHNIDRIFRLPGCFNRGNESKKGLICEKTFSVWTNANKYSLSDFGSASSASPKSGSAPTEGYQVTDKAEKVEALDDLRTTNSSGVWLNIRLLISQGAPCQMNEEMRAEYERSYGEDDKKSRTDRSEYVMQVAAALVRLGVPDSQILGILTDSRWAISAHVLDQGDRFDSYAERQVRRAHGYADADVKAEAPTPVEYMELIPEMIPLIAKKSKNLLAKVGFDRLKKQAAANDKFLKTGKIQHGCTAGLDLSTAQAVALEILLQHPTMCLTSIGKALGQTDLGSDLPKQQVMLIGKAQEEQEKAKEREAERRSREEANKDKQVFTVKGPEVDVVDVMLPQINRYFAAREDVYTVGRSLARWSQTNNTMTMYDADSIAAAVSQGFAFKEVRETKDGYVESFMCMPPTGIRKSYLATGYYPGVREVEAVLHHPAVTPNGDVLGLSAGYDQDHKFLFPEGHNQVDVPLQESYRLVHDIFRDFPECAVPGAMALLFTCLMRACLPETPMMFINAPEMGSGKSLLAAMCLILAYGSEPSPQPQPKTEEEFEKSCKAHISQNPGKALLLDDFKGRIDYNLLKTLLTAKEIAFRILGTNREFRGPVNFLTIMTGNHADLDPELKRRSIQFDVNTGEEFPTQRVTSRTPAELRAYVKTNRTLLLSAVLNILTDALRNATAEDNTAPMGSFETWAGTVGKSVIYVGKMLRGLGLLSDRVVLDVVPNVKKDSEESDGCPEALAEIYKFQQSGYWLVKDLRGPAKVALDELLGTTGEGHSNDARGKRLKKYTDRPRTFEATVYKLVKEGRKYQILATGPATKQAAAAQVHREAAQQYGSS